jgi:hypothetical protein
VDEADHSPLSRVEIENEWNFTHTSALRFRGVHTVKFTFTNVSLSATNPTSRQLLYGPKASINGLA